ncbi:hypothetical protein [Variovorax fucosicus]|uniref:hypothetical protein n=1 Tax=Variovorax fucosicus TaxID=3053517 RepID=UPI0025775F4C|nr:hypothetical protein [Variovorax sp. J22G47]MDM0057509.1 hypothetical protein [Variovorax sp. J22G47]
MVTRYFFAPPLALLLAAGLTGCGPSGGQPTVASTTSADPTPYQNVMGIISDAEKFPAAGDDLTMYIGDRFAEVEKQMLLTRVEGVPAAPTF